MADIQNLSSKSVKPLTLLNKTNEIIDTVNEQLNTSYTETNPALTSAEGICTWIVTHNLGTEDISCTVYENDEEIFVKNTITSENVVTITINSSSNISKDTYSVLILAKGGLSGDSGSSSITIDSELNSTSTNPVQNKVIYPSLSGFIPANTIINVKADGTGDFTNLVDAISYLNGKWSNGPVIIKLGEGSFELTADLNIATENFNFSYLYIKGVSKSSTTVFRNSWSGRWQCEISINNNGTPIWIQDLTFKCVRQDGVRDTVAIRSNIGGRVRVSNIAIADSTTGLQAYSGGTLVCLGTIDLSNTSASVASQCVGLVEATPGTTFNISNSSTAFSVVEAGRIALSRITVNKTNVTNQYSQNINTITNNGVILVG